MPVTDIVWRAGDVTVPLSASVGSATALTGSDADSLMRVADDAMYASKQGGKGRVSCVTARL